MRTQVQVRFDASNIPGGAETVLGPSGCGSDVAVVTSMPVLGQVVVWVTLDTTDPRLPALRSLLDRHRESPLEVHRDVFTEAEMNSAPLLVMVPTHDCEISGGVKWGMTYDLSDACPACGTGGRQTSAVFVAGEQLGDLEGRRACATIFSHILIDDGLAADLARIGATGLSFRSVYARMPDGRQIKLRWQQVCADKTLAPMSSRTTGLVRDRSCETCCRNGYSSTIAEPMRVVYRATDLRDADDVNLSWENQGYAVRNRDIQESLLSYPWMLASPRVRRVFCAAGVTEIDWLPVRVQEGS